MEWFIAVVVIAALGVAALAAAGGMGAMSNDPIRDTYRQDLPSDRRLGADDVAGLRFGVTLRGYAMSQVDDVLARLRHEIAERDAVIAELTARAASSDPDEHVLAEEPFVPADQPFVPADQPFVPADQPFVPADQAAVPVTVDESVR